MGCAECKLLRLLKFENCIEDLIGVDMDTTVMYPSRRHLEPLTTDYIFRRPKPLRVRLMKGTLLKMSYQLIHEIMYLQALLRMQIRL